MKLFSAGALYLLCIASQLTAAVAQEPVTSSGRNNGLPLAIRLLTNNIRYNATSLFEGEEPWQVRRSKLVNQLRFNSQQPAETFLCLQEVLNNQLLDILTDLNSDNATSEWSYVGVGRDDGETRGEYSPIFYRPSTWEVNEFETVWLSETPTIPSRGWDAGSIRILTIGVFTHRTTNRKLVGMCTHLDNAGSVSRLNSAKIIIDQINQYTRNGSSLAGNGTALPVFLGGDFNSETDQEAYLEMSKADSPVADVRLAIPAIMRYGETNTFTDFTLDKSDDSLIDFIWTGPKISQPWSVKTYGVLSNRFEDDEVFNSDHRAVLSDLLLE